MWMRKGKLVRGQDITYLEEHEVLWALRNTIAYCNAFSYAALRSKPSPANELDGVHAVDDENRTLQAKKLF